MQLDVLTAGTYTWVAGAPITLTTEWQQFMLTDVSPSRSGPCFFALNHGTVAGIFYYDDIELTGVGEGLDPADILAGNVVSGGGGAAGGAALPSINGGGAIGSAAAVPPPASAVQLLETDFETDADSFTVYVYAGDARAQAGTAAIGQTLPEAGYSLKSGEAAHGGKFGVQIKVRRLGWWNGWVWGTAS